jgi:hypothetical protein
VNGRARSDDRGGSRGQESSLKGSGGRSSKRWTSCRSIGPSASRERRATEHRTIRWMPPDGAVARACRPSIERREGSLATSDRNPAAPTFNRQLEARRSHRIAHKPPHGEFLPASVKVVRRLNRDRIFLLPDHVSQRDGGQHAARIGAGRAKMKKCVVGQDWRKRLAVRSSGSRQGHR